MELRVATPADARALLEIYGPYVTETSITFETEVPTLEEFQRRIRDISKQFPYLVAEENGEILGYAYAHPYHERAAYHWTVETSIYVKMDCHRKRIGARLYGALLALLRLQGVHTACAAITMPNDRSMAFHEKMGFQLGGVLPAIGYKFGTWYGTAYCYCRLRDLQETPEKLTAFPALDKTMTQEILSGNF